MTAFVAVAALIASAALTAACGGGDDESASVTGTVTYRERIAISPDAEITVRLEDVSMADAPAETLSEVRFSADGKQVPFPFELPYDPDEIVESNTYAVRAEIVDGGQALFTTTTSYPVITQGNPTQNVEMVLVRTG